MPAMMNNWYKDFREDDMEAVGWRGSDVTTALQPHLTDSMKRNNSKELDNMEILLLKNGVV